MQCYDLNQHRLYKQDKMHNPFQCKEQSIQEQKANLVVAMMVYLFFSNKYNTVNFNSLYLIVQILTSYQFLTCVLVINAPANPPKCGKSVNETDGSQDQEAI